MRYTVNYSGAFFTGDSDGWNMFETNSWERAQEIFYALHNAGFEGVYIKDEEYQCSMYWDEKEKEFYWD